jgi:hypothetical protein
MLYHRINRVGWDLEKAIMTPVGKTNCDASKFDAGLNALLKSRQKGESFSTRQISNACGVTRQAVDRIVKRSLRKIYRRLQMSMDMNDDEFRSCFGRPRSDF